MITQEMVTRIQLRATNYTREEILAMMDECQQFVYGEDVFQTRSFDYTTGRPPYLVTQANTLTYDCPADCRRTVKIFRDWPDSAYMDGYGEGAYLYGRKEFVSILVNTEDALENRLARVIFLYQPTASATVYFHLYQKKVTKLTSANIQLVLPPGKCHTWLMDGVIALFTKEDYGGIGPWEYFERTTAKKIRNELNSGKQDRAQRTPIRPENRSINRYGYRIHRRH